MKTKQFSFVLLIAILSACGGGGYNPPDSGGQFPTPITKPTPHFTTKNSHPFYVAFTNESKHADSYNWDFGDGTKSSEESPVHKYKGKGVYKVTLTVYAGRSNYGWVHTETYTKNVTVTEPTRCYVTGVVYEKVPKNNEYYKVKFTDDYILFETLYWHTGWALLSSANIPYTYNLKSNEMIDGNFYKLTC